MFKYGIIIYEKSIHLNKLGSFNFVKLLYENDDWIGSWNNKFCGVKNKVKPCYTNNNKTKILLFECNNHNLVNEAKEQIRNLFKIEKHSAHINDTYEETIKTAQAVFNDNSLHFLNYSRLYKKNYRKL